MGCETYAVAPGTLLPPAPEVLGCDHVTSDLDSVLPELDVVYMLRVQQERLEVPRSRPFASTTSSSA